MFAGKNLRLKVVIIAVSIIAAGLVGCGHAESGSREKIEYTVVEDEDIPVQLKSLIDEKCKETVRLTYATRDYTYLVAGYGTMNTSGYSIRVNDVYKTDEFIVADITLIGPKTDEPVTEMPSTPYVVIKIEKRDEPVVFRM